MDEFDLNLAIEESLRFYQEVELPRLSQVNTKDSDIWNVADPRNQGAGCSRYPDVVCLDTEDIGAANYDLPSDRNQGAGCSRNPDVLYQDNDDNGAANKNLQPESPVDRDVSEVPDLYRGAEARGFHVSAGRNWIYPTNYPERKYQFDIVEKALYQNTLVSLPTGLGKTFIAAVVMYNFYRWYPQGKIVFTAPTKPLVNQQVESCYKVMGIPREDTVEMTGTILPSARKKMWLTKRVVFTTPQTITNDLTSGLCPAESIRCVVIDEAHKALKNYHYCQLVKSIAAQNKNFRLLALSATPGNNLDAIKQVLQNLLISHIELRTEESPDITPYTHKRNIEMVVVKQSQQIKTYLERFLCIIDQFARQLRNNKLLPGCTLSKYGLVQAQQRFYLNPPSSFNPSMKGQMAADFALCIPLCHAKDMLESSGLRAFYNAMESFRCNPDKWSLVARLENSEPFQELMADVKNYVDQTDVNKRDPNESIMNPTQIASGPQYVGSHPKMEKVRDIVLEHFDQLKDKNVSSKVIIFCEYRETVDEVEFILNQSRPVVRPRIFVGQSDTKNSKGLKQCHQKKILQQFRSGHTNTLVATCVGEEGLDIGEVDLIVCYDVVSHTRLVQRMGRTGRLRDGRIVHLVSEGKELTKYKTALKQNIDIRKKIASESNQLQPFFYRQNPDMFPQGMEQPTCRKMLIIPKREEFTPKVTKGKNQDLRAYMTKGTKKEKEVFLTEEMYQGLLAMYNGKNPLDGEDLLPPQRFSCLMTADEMQFNNDNTLAQRNKIDLGNYIDWQRLRQSGPKGNHSTDTDILVDLMAYSEKLNTGDMNESITGCNVSQLVQMVCQTKLKPKKQQAENGKKVLTKTENVKKTPVKKKTGKKTPVKKKTKKNSVPARKNAPKDIMHCFLQSPAKLSSPPGITNLQQAVDQMGIPTEPLNESNDLLIIDEEVEIQLPIEKVVIQERLLAVIGKVDSEMACINPLWQRQIKGYKGTGSCNICSGLCSHDSPREQRQRTHKEKADEVLQWLQEHYTNVFQISSQKKDQDVNLNCHIKDGSENGDSNVNSYIKDDKENVNDLWQTSTHAEKQQLDFDLGLDCLLIEDDDDIGHERDSTFTDKPHNSSISVEMNVAKSSSVVPTSYQRSELLEAAPCQPVLHVDDRLDPPKSVNQSVPSKQVEMTLSPILASQKDSRMSQNEKTSKAGEKAKSPILKSQRQGGNQKRGAKKMKLSLNRKSDNTKNTSKAEENKTDQDDSIFHNQLKSPNIKGPFGFLASPTAVFHMVTPDSNKITHYFPSSSEEKPEEMFQRSRNPNSKVKKKLEMHSITEPMSDLRSTSYTSKNTEKPKVVCEKTEMHLKSPVIGSSKGKSEKVPVHNFAVSPILGLQSQGNARTKMVSGLPYGPVSSTPKQHKVALFSQSTTSSKLSGPAANIPNKPDTVRRVGYVRPTFMKGNVLTPITEEGSSANEDSFKQVSLIKGKEHIRETTVIVPSIHFNVFDNDNIDSIFDGVSDDETQIDFHPTEAKGNRSKMEPCNSKSVHYETTCEESMYTIDQMLAKVDAHKSELSKASTSGHKLTRNEAGSSKLSLKPKREHAVRRPNNNYDSDKDLFASDDDYTQQCPDTPPTANGINVKCTKKLGIKSSRVNQTSQVPDLDIVRKTSCKEQILDCIEINSSGESTDVRTFNGVHDLKNLSRNNGKENVLLPLMPIVSSRHNGTVKKDRFDDQEQMDYVLAFNDVSTLKKHEPLNAKDPIPNLKRNIKLPSLSEEEEENSKPPSPKKQTLNNSLNRPNNTLTNFSNKSAENENVFIGNRLNECTPIKRQKVKRSLVVSNEDTQDLWKEADMMLEKSSLACDFQPSLSEQPSPPEFTRKVLRERKVLRGRKVYEEGKLKAGVGSTCFNTTIFECSPVLEERSVNRSKILSDNNISSDSTIGGARKGPKVLANISTTSEESPLIQKRLNGSIVSKRTNLVSSSSDDDDFETPLGNAKSVAKRVVKETGGATSKRKGCAYLDDEASESSVDRRDSTDGENTSGLDEYDESFVHDGETSQPTATQNIQAQYIRYRIHAAPDVGRDRPAVHRPCVFSQAVRDDDSYLDDSFVDDAETEEPAEMSVLELAEHRLRRARKKKKTRRKKRKLDGPGSSDESRTESPSTKKSRKRRRIMTLDSSDSAENNSAEILGPDQKTSEGSKHVFAVPNQPRKSLGDGRVPTVNNSALLDVHDYEDLLQDVNWDDNLYSSTDTACKPKTVDTMSKHILPLVTATISSSSRTDSGLNKCDVFNTYRKTAPSSHTLIDEGNKLIEKEASKPRSDPLVLIVAQRQVAVASAIVSHLRARHNVKILTQSMQEADFVVSWRMGVSRVSFSDLTNNVSKDLEKIVNSMRSAFQKPYLIIENDKKNELCPASGHNCSMWNNPKRVAAKLMALRTVVKVIYVVNHEQTARCLAKLIDMEAKLGHCIEVWPADLMTRVNDRVQFYYSLPGVNYATALRLQRLYPNPYLFINLRVEGILAVTGVSRETAAQIKLVLKRSCYQHY